MWRNCIYLTCFDIQNNSFLFEYSFSSSTLSIASLLLLPSQEQHSCLSIIFLAANALPTDRKPPWKLNKAFAWTIFFNPLFLGFPLLLLGGDLQIMHVETEQLYQHYQNKSLFFAPTALSITLPIHNNHWNCNRLNFFPPLRESFNLQCHGLNFRNYLACHKSLKCSILIENKT